MLVIWENEHSLMRLCHSLELGIGEGTGHEMSSEHHYFVG